MHRPRKNPALIGAAAASAFALMASSGVVVAQEETQTTDDPMMQAYQLDIRSGTCEQIGEVVFPLGDISSDLMVHGEAAGDEMVGSVEDQRIALNLTLVAATLDDLGAANHVLSAVRSADDGEMQDAEQQQDMTANSVVCGDIGGTVFDGGTLVIRLDEENASGYVGMALFREDEDGNTAVYSMLTEKDASVESPAMTTDQDAADQPGEEGADESPSADEETDVTVEVTIEDGENVDVEVDEPEESPEETPEA